MEDYLDKDFVPYYLALELKDLGFNIGCLTYYFIGGKRSNYFKKVHKNGGLLVQKPYKFHCTVPLYSQALRWFRDMGYHFDIYPRRKDLGKFYGGSLMHDTDETRKSYGSNFASYELAEKELLTQLIILHKTKIVNELDI